MQTIQIADKEIGKNKPCFIVAEIGTNHNMDKKVVKELVSVAHYAGVDAVKFQTYHWYDIVNPGIKASDYGYRSEKYWYEVIQERLSMPLDWYEELFHEIRIRGMIPFSTPHCPGCANFLSELNVPLFKVASMELTNLPFLAKLATLKKPILLSVGMGDIEEILKAVRVIMDNGVNEIALTHCVSLYPAQPEELNLKRIVSLSRLTNLPTGFSDHSLGTVSSVAAVALGACVIEKHITLNRNMDGPDHKFALEPDELIRLVKEIRDTEKALGSSEIIISSHEVAKRAIYRKSLLAAKDIAAGEVIQEEDIMVTRPENGLPPEFKDIIIGMQTVRSIKKYEPINWDNIKGGRV